MGQEKEKRQNVTIQTVAVRREWTETFAENSTDHYAYDYAFLVTKELSGCKNSLPIELKLSYNLAAIGYPKSFEKGDVMCVATGHHLETSHGCVAMYGNTLTEGASGGAWLDSQAPEAKVVGLNSFIVSIMPNIVYGPEFTEKLQALYQAAVKESLNARYIKLSNKGAFVVRMQILYGGNRGTDEHGEVIDFAQEKFEQSGYHDICAAGERTLDLTTAKIPDGACVQLKAYVVAGKDRIAEERFIYRADSAQTKCYTITGITANPKLRLT